MLSDYIHKQLQRYMTKVCRNVITATSDRTLGGRETGSICDNYGAGGAVIFNLPTSKWIGQNFTFVVAAAQNLSINPGDADQIVGLGTTAAAGVAITANDEGESCDIYWNGSVWVARVTGTWT